MHVLLLPFFIVLLLIKIVPFLFTLLVKKLLPYRSLIVSFLIFSITSIALLTSLSIPSIENRNTSYKKNLIEQKNNLEKLLEKQPTHRDILLNLAKINQVLDNEQQALDLRNKAFNLDPNDIAFQKD